MRGRTSGACACVLPVVAERLGCVGSCARRLRECERLCPHRQGTALWERREPQAPNIAPTCPERHRPPGPDFAQVAVARNTGLETRQQSRAKALMRGRQQIQRRASPHSRVTPCDTAGATWPPGSTGSMHHEPNGAPHCARSARPPLPLPQRPHPRTGMVTVVGPGVLDCHLCGDAMGLAAHDDAPPSLPTIRSIQNHPAQGSMAAERASRPTLAASAGHRYAHQASQTGRELCGRQPRISAIDGLQ
eukprot:294194-Chlamydomonas_euryale.AAC.2